MANFDSNRWYQIFKDNSHGQAMVGTSLYNAGLGAVFFSTTNSSAAVQKWQIFTYNSSYYVLRTQDSGPKGYLGVEASTDGTVAGNTVPGMRNYTLSDNSMFWQWTPWGDGTFYLTNAQNGTAWHLQVNSNSLMSMSSNITSPQSGQSFSWNATDKIDDPRYSSVLVATTSSSGTTISTTTSTSTSSDTPSSSSQNGLSSGVQAAIGASIGVVGVIIILALGFIFLKRRKRRTAAYNKEPVFQPVPNDPPKEMYNGRDTAELHSQALPMELQGNGNHATAELPGEPQTR